MRQIKCDICGKVISESKVATLTITENCGFYVNTKTWDLCPAHQGAFTTWITFQENTSNKGN